MIFNKNYYWTIASMFFIVLLSLGFVPIFNDGITLWGILIGIVNSALVMIWFGVFLVNAVKYLEVIGDVKINRKTP